MVLVDRDPIALAAGRAIAGRYVDDAIIDTDALAVVRVARRHR